MIHANSFRPTRSGVIKTLSLVALVLMVSSAFAGWDRSTNDPTAAIAIHHPSTDEKSISFEYDPTSPTGISEPPNPDHRARLCLTRTTAWLASFMVDTLPEAARFLTGTDASPCPSRPSPRTSIL